MPRKQIKKTLETEKIQSVRLRSPVCVSRTDSIESVIGIMKTRRRGCAIILDNDKICGIFTERDLLTRVLQPSIDLTSPISKVMTKNPAYLTLDTSILDVIRLMSDRGYRHVPLVDQDEKIRGFVSVRDILDYIAEHFPSDVYNLPPDPDQIQRAPEGA